MVGTQVPDELHVEVADRLVRVRVARSSAVGVDLRCRVRAIAQVHRGQAEVRPVNDGLIQPLQQDDEGIGGRSLPCARTRPGKSSGDAATSAAPIAFFRLTKVLLSISFPLPLIPGSSWSRATAAARKEGLASQRPRLCGCLPQEGVWARLDSLNADATPLCQMCQTLPGLVSSPTTASCSWKRIGCKLGAVQALAQRRVRPGDSGDRIPCGSAARGKAASRKGGGWSVAVEQLGSSRDRAPGTRRR